MLLYLISYICLIKKNEISMSLAVVIDITASLPAMLLTSQVSHSEGYTSLMV